MTKKEKEPEELPDPWELRDRNELKAIFTALEERAKLRVDASLVDEIVSAVSNAKESRQSVKSMRMPRSLKTEDEMHKLVKLYNEVQAKRDRVIEIKLDHIPLKNTLQTLYDRALGFLMNERSVYAITPAPRRDATIKLLLQPLIERQREVDLIIQSADTASTHLKDTYYTLKELREIGTTYVEGNREQKGV